MKKPSMISFTDLDVAAESLTRIRGSGPMNPNWTRVQFPVRDTHETPGKIEAWLDDNCSGTWASYCYSMPGSHSPQSQMVVRFASRDDALMFKLRGGHQTQE